MPGQIPCHHQSASIEIDHDGSQRACFSNIPDLDSCRPVAGDPFSIGTPRREVGIAPSGFHPALHRLLFDIPKPDERVVVARDPLSVWAPAKVSDGMAGVQRRIDSIGGLAPNVDRTTLCRQGDSSCRTAPIRSPRVLVMPLESPTCLPNLILKVMPLPIAEVRFALFGNRLLQ